jgi:predicted permease
MSNFATSFVDNLRQDVRYAFRTFVTAPSFAIITALTLAFGMGANTAIFSLVNGFLLRPLPVPHPEQLNVLAVDQQDAPLGAIGLSYPQLIEFRKQAEPYGDVFAQALGFMGLSADGRTDQLSLSVVTQNFFSGLEVNPALGRLVLPTEGEQSGEPSVLVLGYAYWQKRFGGDPSVVGKQVRLQGKPVTIIGVVPRDFHGSFSPFEMDGYIPLSTAAQQQNWSGIWTDQNSKLLLAMVRLKPDVSRTQAQSALNVIAPRIGPATAVEKPLKVRLIPEKLSRPIPYANDAFILISGLFVVLSALVLLLACTNVVNILLARATVRRREVAIRAALGAGRGRLAIQVLTETFLIALAGGIGGIAIAEALGRLESSIHLPNFPLQLDSGLDWRVLAYAFSAIAATTLLTGLSPALFAMRADVNTVLHSGISGSTGKRKTHGDLMVAQIAFSLTLLIVAGLFVRSLGKAQRVDLGFNPDHLLNASLDPSEANYNQAETTEFYRQLLSRVRALPGVESASLAASVPLGNLPTSQQVFPEGRPIQSTAPRPAVLFNRVAPSYFQTMQIPLLRGRDFTDADGEGSPQVAIVNQTMAAQYWPGDDPIGKRFSLKSSGETKFTILGVAKDGKYRTVADDAQPYFYLPVAQNFVSARVLEVRFAIPMHALIHDIRGEVESLAPGLPIADVRSMDEALNGANGLFVFRLGAALAAVMGGLALLLAAVGVYGVVSYSVTQRRREIGVRIALGASRLDILRLILGHGLRLVLTGVAIGLLASWGLSRTMRHLLIGISPSDPLTYACVAALLSVIALLACWIPCRRATQIDPIATLRCD